MTSQSNKEELLLPITQPLDYGTAGRGPEITHLQTYTAGEDGSRLAEMAKEFGLAQQRQPRNQVRQRTSSSTPLRAQAGRVYRRMLDPGFADVRLRSVYVSHSQSTDSIDDPEGRRLMGRLPSWKEDSVGLMAVDEQDEKDGIVDPHAQDLGGDLISAILGIIKAMVGPALLYLPHGFANTGWVLSIPILIFSTSLYLASSTCLLESWKLESSLDSAAASAEEGVRKQRTILSYPELAYRAFGAKGETLVKIGIALMQSGVCLTYLIFVPQNLQSCTRILLHRDIPASQFMVVMLICQIPMSWIRDIRKLTVSNLVANILIMYGLATCLWFAFSSAVKSDGDRGPVEEIVFKLSTLSAFKDGWFLFIGTSVLLFEGSITLLVPLQEAVYAEEDRQRFPIVYQKVILGIITFYTFFGIVCWMSFGEGVHTVMTTSLPPGTLTTTVQLAYSVAVIFTFPLQNFPSLEIVCRSVASVFQDASAETPSPCRAIASCFQQRNVVSSMMVCGLALIAIFTMDSLDKVVSLMGSLLGCPLAFVFPPLIQNSLDTNLTNGKRLKNKVVAGLGICAMLLASVTTLLTW